MSLPETASPEIAKLNKPPTPRVQGALKDLHYQVLITDLTSTAAISEFQKLQFNNKHVNALKHFGHAKQAQYPHVEFVALDYVNLRQETRYLYQTEIRLEQEEKARFRGIHSTFQYTDCNLNLPTK